MHGQTVRFSIFILSIMVLVCGCRSLPGVQLGECEKLSYDEFAEIFQFDIPDVLRYRYTLHWKDKELFSNVGMTMYSAKWQDGQFEILKNNVKIPDTFLERSILSDLLLLYRRLPAEGDCIQQNIADGTLWLKTVNNWSGGSGCFVLIDNQPAWSGLREGKVYFKALASIGNSNIPAYITIENYKEGYSAQIRYSNGSSEE